MSKIQTTKYEDLLDSIRDKTELLLDPSTMP